MRNLFPYLTPSNIKGLFTSRKVSPGKSINSSAPQETVETEMEGVNLELFPSELYDSFGRLVKASTGFPCQFICDVTGKVIWETSERAFDIESVEKDILTHLRESTGSEIGKIKRLVAYPQGQNEKPMDGVVRFGVVVPLRMGGQLVGAWCALNDGEMVLTAKMKQQFEDVVLVLSANLEANAANLQTRLENEALAEIHEFLRKGWGDAFLGMLCKKLAAILEVEWAFVVNFDAAEDWQGKTVAAIFQGVSVENFTYQLKNSPLMNLKGSEVVLIRDEARNAFPDDQKIVQEEIEAFAGLGLVNPKGKLSGALILMGRQPIQNRRVVTKMLEAVGPRAAAEMNALKRHEHDGVRTRAHEQRFEKLFQTDAVGVLIATMDGKIEAANPALLENLQYSEREIKGKSLSNLCLAEDSQQEAKFRQECADGERSGYQMLKTYRRSDQSSFAGLASVSVMPGSEGDGVVFLEAIRDMDQEQETLLQFQSLQKEFEQVGSEKATLFDISPHALAKVDLEGSVLESNGAWLKLLNYAWPEMKGMRLRDLGAKEDDCESLDQALRQGMQGNATHEAGLLTLKNKKGNPLRLTVFVSPMVADGGSVAAMMVALRDATREEQQSETIEKVMQGLSALNDLPGVALAWLDQNAGFIRSSLEAEKVLKRKMPELGKLSLVDLLPANQEQGVRAGLAKLSSGQIKVFQWKCEIAVPQGQAVYAEFAVIKIADQGNGESFLLSCRNRTDEHLFQQEAMACSDQLEGTLAGAGQGMVFVDAAGVILRTNQVSCSLFGLTAEELRGGSLYAWLGEEDQSRVSQRLASAADKNAFSLEVGIHEKAGQQIPVRLTGRAVISVGEAAETLWILFLEDQRPLQIREQQITDLTHQLAAMELEAQSLKQVQSTGICLVQMDERVTEANAYLEAKLGYSIPKGALILSDLFRAKEITDEFHQGVADCLSGRRTLFQFQGLINRKDQQEIWMELCLHPVKDEDGSVVYLIATWQDTTQLMEWEDRWQGVDAPVRELLDSSQLGLVFLDQALQVTQVNAAICQILDTSAELMKAREISEFIAEDDVAVVEESFQKDESNHSLKLIGRAGESRAAHVTIRKFTTGKSEDKVWYLMLVRLREMEAKLEAETLRWRQRFESVFDRDDVPMGICDRNGQLLEVNQGLCRLTGLEREALKYRAWSDYLVDQKWELPVSEQKSSGCIESVFNFGGECEIHGRLLVQRVAAGGDGVSAQYAWLLQDITGEMKAKAWGALRDARLKAFLANPVVGLAVLDRNGEVVEANEMFEAFFEAKPERCIGKDIKQWLPEPDRELFASEWDTLSHGERSRFQFETLIEVAADTPATEDEAAAAEGAQKSSRLTMVLLDAEETTGFAVVLLEDLTELKETRESLEQTSQRLTVVESEQRALEEQMSTELAEKQAALDELRLMLDKKESEHESVTAELAALVLAHQALSALSDQQKSEGEKLAANLQQALSESEATQNDLEQQQRRCSEMESELSELRARQELLQSDLSSKQVDFDHLNIVKAELEEKISSQSKLLTEKEEAKKRFEERFKTAAEKAKGYEQEITELKQQVEKYQAEQGPTLKEMIQYSEVALVAIDEQRMISEYNQAFAALIEADVENLSDQRLDELLGLSLDEEQAQTIQSVFDGTVENFQLEVPLLLADQSYRWLRMNGSLINQKDRDLHPCLVVVQDVNPLYEAQNQQAVVEQRFLALAESGSIGMMMADAEGGIFFCNPAMTELLGCDESELIGKSLNDFAHADDSREDVQLDERCQQGEIDDYQIEKILVTAAGKLLWARMNVKVIRFENGDFWYSVRTLEDLTNLHETSEKLIRTESRLGKIFQASEAALLLLDRHGKVIELSEGASQFFGSDSKEVIRKKLSHMGEEGTDQRFGNLFSTLQGGQVKEVRLKDEIVNAAGEKVQALAVLHAVLDEDGKFESAVASIREWLPENLEKEAQPELPAASQEPASHQEPEAANIPQAAAAPPDESPDKTEVIPPKPTVIKDLEPPKSRTQALKDSVKISESQKIDTSKFNLPKPKLQPLQKEKLRHAVPGHSSLHEGWLVADSSGSVVLVNSHAIEILSMEREQALLKPLAEILHVKDQQVWQIPSTEMDEELAQANLQKTVIWDYHRETVTLVQMSRPVLNKVGDVVGTAVVFLPFEKIKQLPGYRDDHEADAGKKCMKIFKSSIEMLQHWVEEEMAEHLKKCQRLSPSDLAIEAVTLEEKLKNK